MSWMDVKVGKRGPIMFIGEKRDCEVGSYKKAGTIQ